MAGELQAFCLELEMEPPTYRVTKEEGPPHDRHFEMVCHLNKQLNRTGAGKTKKQAKKEAGKIDLEVRSRLMTSRKFGDFVTPPLCRTKSPVFLWASYMVSEILKIPSNGKYV